MINKCALKMTIKSITKNAIMMLLTTIAVFMFFGLIILIIEYPLIGAFIALAGIIAMIIVGIHNEYKINLNKCTGKK